MLRSIATIVAATGALAAIVGWLWNLVAPTPDANIGAGALVVLGLPVAGIGVVLLIVSALLDRRREP
ncbi:hypothetical protein [Agrococcus jejuensis]|uniref:Uncharacterized protein n=1 Tax=Agrococcus jejuensis TaxID=399736 RepID=A0A1G8DGM2_9MICO|nr:hypothetical protein [Agrococcus jejuensis]SDH56816.1 hypothetical protein SAMN04489720_1640 [Agrococcus jejuensis]